MSTTLAKKSREGISRKTFLKAPYKHEVPKDKLSNTISTFEKAYQQVLHRRNNDFSTLDSPNLNQELHHLKTSEIDDPYRSALSTSSTKTIVTLQRKKYMQMKQRIEQQVKQLEKRSYTTLKDLFDAKQTMLTFFLNGFAFELEKECRDKADILKYLWNTSQHLIGSISEALTSSAKEKEKDELQNNLKSHIQYQGLLEGYQRKQIQLNQKSNMERVTIHKLVYELRFKRKEVNKLYRNQRLLVNRLNDYKSQNLHLQSTYLDLLCQLRDLPPERAQMLIKARQEVRKSKQVRFKITANRKNAKNQIQAQLNNQKIEELQSLYEEIKEIANNQANSPNLISTLITASIQNFGIKNDDTTLNKHPVENFSHKQTKIEVGIQIDGLQFIDKTKTHEMTQFGYLQRLKLQLINNRDTQTYCQYPKKKLLIDVSTPIEPLQMTMFYVKQNFLITRVCQQSFKFHPGLQTTLKVIGNTPSHLQKQHRKNYSELNLRKSFQKFSSNYLEKFIEEKDDQCSNSSRQSLQDLKHGVNLNSKQNSQQKSSNRILHMLANTTNNTPKKERFTSILSNSSNKVLSSSTNVDNDLKKSNFAPYVSPNSNQQSPTNGNVSKETSYKSEIHDTIKSRLSAKHRENAHYESVIPKFKKSHPVQSVRHNFMGKTNYFNIEIDAVKQEEINNIFSKNQSNAFEPESDEDQDSKKQLEAAELEDKQRIKSAQFTFLNENQQCLTPLPASKQKIRKNSGMSIAQSIRSKQHSSYMKYRDQNQLLLNLCRVSYYKSHKKVKERLAVYKYNEEFTCVRDKIQFVARDVKNLIVHREAVLRKTINPKNIKNTYKILMMTFTKAYDAFNKGTLKGNLIYPLFESFALLYGNINNNKIYRKMIHFIAGISLSRQNAILRFFLFFLGLDSTSPYSAMVTVSEVFLCLKLLENISVDGKVTLNIQSIYTDTTRIKSQLLNILNQQKIPSTLSQAIDTRVVKQLQNSCLYKNSTAENSHLKLNIYNIILLVIQEVIKCKNSLRDSFMPLLMRYEQFKTNRKIPVHIVQVLLADWKAPHFDPFRLRALLQVITKNGKRETVTIEQFCSILFESGLVSIDQLHHKSDFIYRHNWTIPNSYIQEMETKRNSGNYVSILQQRQVEMFFKLKGGEQSQNIQKMRRILFEKYYQRKVQNVLTVTIGSGLRQLAIMKQVLLIEQK